jgi:hypothetical protein
MLGTVRPSATIPRLFAFGHGTACSHAQAPPALRPCHPLTKCFHTEKINFSIAKKALLEVVFHAPLVALSQRSYIRKPWVSHNTWTGCETDRRRPRCVKATCELLQQLRCGRPRWREESALLMRFDRGLHCPVVLAALGWWASHSQHLGVGTSVDLTHHRGLRMLRRSRVWRSRRPPA